MLGIPTFGIDITDKGLDQEFITWVEEDKSKFLKGLLKGPNPNLKLGFPFPTMSLKPFY